MMARLNKDQEDHRSTVGEETIVSIKDEGSDF